MIVDSWAIHDRAAYVEHVVASIEGRSLGGMKVVVDAANGAAFEVAGDVFTRAGAEVLADQRRRPTARNINRGCGATEPAGLARVVVENGAFAGLALDGDGDRLIAVDETGRVIDGDHVIAICAVDMRSRGLLRDDTVVVTVMTNLGFRLAMARSRRRGRRDRRRRPVRARGAAARRLLARRRAERARDLPRPRHYRRRARHRPRPARRRRPVRSAP